MSPGSCWNLLLLLLAPAAVGASLRSPLAFRGAAAVDAAGLLEHRTNNSSTKEQLLWGGASLRSPLACGGGEPPPPEQPEQPNSPNSRTARTAEQLPPLPSASPSPVRFRPLPRPEAVYHSAVLRPAALLFFRRRRPPPAPFICGRWLGSISATDGHSIIFPAAKIGFSRLRSLTFPPSLLLPSNPDQLNVP